MADIRVPTLGESVTEASVGKWFKRAGDTVAVELELDNSPRVIAPPADLARALARDRKAAASWEKLSYTKQREMARGLEEAKKPETRERRLAAAIEKLHS